jgi:uncharacterized protein (TIGR03437 family)
MLRMTMLRAAKFALFFSIASVWPLAAQGPTFDTSGNSKLNGTYYFRHVIYVVDSNADQNGYVGDISEGIGVYGTIVFDGNGNYTINNGTVADSYDFQNSGIATESLSCFIGTSACSTSAAVTGTYSISSSGFGLMTNAVTGDQVYGLVGANGVFIGSSTETTQAYNDLLILAPLPSPLPTASTFNGSYTVAGFVPFPGNPSLYNEDVFFQMNPNGGGSLGGVTVTGYEGGNGATTLSQSFSNLTYSFSSGAGVVNFPTNSKAQFFSGQEFLYFSPDGNFFFGGSPTGYDMLTGVRSTSGAQNFGGLYYQAGVDEDFSQISSGVAYIDGYYGSFNATSTGAILVHDRLSDTLDGVTYGETFADSFTPGVSGNYTDTGSSTQYVVADGGAVRIGQGIAPYLGLTVALQAPTFTPSGSVYLNPTGIVNAASFSPFTAGVSDGEYLALFGNNLAPSPASAPSLPLQTMLNGVQVTINGTPVPINYVSSGQLDVVVPLGNTFSVAQIQVINNGVASNIVTELVNATTPGVFTSSYGLGYAIVEHADGSLVSPTSPAQPGETVVAYASGLGTVYPTVPDGSAAPGDPLSVTSNAITVNIGGIPAPVTQYSFTGLAPGFAGLYQVNVTIPSTAAAGDNTLDISGPDSYATQALISIGGGATGAARPRTIARVPASGHARPASPAKRKAACFAGGRKSCAAQVTGGA